MEAPPALPIGRCESCHARFLARPGPCPQCGSAQVALTTVPPEGIVLAAVELTAPAAGWSAPHRLALVELADGVRVLCRVEGALPAEGERQRVRADGAGYIARAETE